MKKEKPEGKKRRSIVFGLIFIAIVITLLATPEILLRLVGYGFDTRPFVPHATMPEMLVENPDMYQKYLSQERNAASFPDVAFVAEKPDDLFRVFVIGGSTAQGFPWPINLSFSRMVEIGLAASGRYSGLEVVNVAASAMSSYYVADMAPKLLEYEPDLLIVYSGHNEYYGRISEGSGGNHFTRRLYLALQEFRVFQWLFSVLGNSNMDSNADGNDQSLMAQQFQDQQFPLDETRDSRVTENFIRNMESVRRTYSRAGVPLLVVSPASNLLDMPPFRSEGSEEELLARESILLEASDNSTTLTESFQDFDLNNEWAADSWILGRIALENQTESAMELLNNARERDLLPFRARNGLVSALESWAEINGVPYIPFEQRLMELNGVDALGSQVFIDHLHLNYLGNAILADQILRTISTQFSWTREQLYLALRSLQPESLARELGYLPLFELQAHWTIEKLMEQEPFLSQFWRLERPGWWTMDNELLDNRELVLGLYEVFRQEPEAVFEALIAEYLDAEEYNVLFRYLEAFQLHYPAFYGSYINLANFYYLQNDLTTARQYFNLGYQWSGRNEDLRALGIRWGFLAP